MPFSWGYLSFQEGNGIIPINLNVWGILGTLPPQPPFRFTTLRFGRYDLPRNYCTFVVEVEDMDNQTHSPFIIPPGKYIVAQLPCIGLKGTEIFSYLFHWQFRMTWWLNHPFWTNMLLKMGASSANFGVKIPTIFELPTFIRTKRSTHKHPFLG